MNNYREFFKNKKVTVVGLGLLGKRLGDIAFLSECGAQVTVTDLKTEKELALSIKKLQKYKNIIYALGGHKLEDFENKDFILKGQGVPLDSIYIEHARKNGIPIEMDESLFVKFVSKLNLKVKIIGVTGTRGKSTTTMLIYEILKASGARVHLGGNIKGTAALPLLKKLNPPAGGGDIVVFELSSWQLQGFGEDKISPHISVFTNFMPDHMNYYGSTSSPQVGSTSSPQVGSTSSPQVGSTTLTTSKALKRYFGDKSYIYKFQTKEDTLVLGPHMKGLVKNTKSKMITANIKNIPKSWKIKLLGTHNLENIACAVEVSRVLKIKEEIIKKTVEKFKAISGRLEFVKEIKGVKIYNDTNSCTPEATSVALETIQKNIILILGGSDKNLELKKLVKDIKKYVKAVVLIPGNGTARILKDLKNTKVPLCEEKDLKDVVNRAYCLSKRGDAILFSPAFTSFGMFNNEYDRGDQFMKIVRNLK
jgi:UDP-N-acetylmuramoylalanine--D-glutamate ligase